MRLEKGINEIDGRAGACLNISGSTRVESTTESWLGCCCCIVAMLSSVLASDNTHTPHTAYAYRHTHTCAPWVNKCLPSALRHPIKSSPHVIFFWLGKESIYRWMCLCVCVGCIFFNLTANDVVCVGNYQGAPVSRKRWIVIIYFKLIMEYMDAQHKIFRRQLSHWVTRYYSRCSWCVAVIFAAVGHERKRQDPSHRILFSKRWVCSVYISIGLPSSRVRSKRIGRSRRSDPLSGLVMGWWCIKLLLVVDVVVVAPESIKTRLHEEQDEQQQHDSLALSLLAPDLLLLVVILKGG